MPIGGKSCKSKSPGKRKVSVLGKKIEGKKIELNYVFVLHFFAKRSENCLMSDLSFVPDLLDGCRYALALAQVAS